MSDVLVETRAQVRELITRWSNEGRFNPRSDAWLRSFDLEFTAELAALGLIGMTWPTEYGGGGRSNLERLAVTEELLRGGAPVAAHWIADRQIGPAVLRHGTEALKRELLPGIAAGRFVFCLGMSEPQAGSDLANVGTRAIRVEGGWRISGRKIWTSHAHRATHSYVLARTSVEERKHRGLSEFLVDMDSAGITVDPIVDMSGEHHFNEVTFSDVFVAKRRLLGVEGEGWTQLTEQLSFERGGPERVLSSYPLVSEILAAAHESGDGPLLEAVGRLVARLGTLRALCAEIAVALDVGEAPVAQAASLKLLGNAFERDVIETARRIPGSHAVPAEGALGDALLASPAFSLRGGATDVLLSIVGKREVRR